MHITGICGQPGNEPTATTPSLWESRRPREPAEAVQARHQKARILCHRCPLLTACERALSDYEQAGIPIDGVTAARYSDVKYGSQWQGDIQTHCAGCAAPLIPQKREYQLKNTQNKKQHIGEGLCEDCYPALARTTQKAQPR